MLRYHTVNLLSSVLCSPSIFWNNENEILKIQTKRLKDIACDQGTSTGKNLPEEGNGRPAGKVSKNKESHALGHGEV